MATTITGSGITTGTTNIHSTGVVTESLSCSASDINVYNNLVFADNKNSKKQIPAWNPLTGTTAGSVTEPSNTVPRTLDSWEIVGHIGMSQGNPGLQYRHIKLNYASSSAMMYFWLNGYGYNYGNIDTKMGLYMYTGTSILNKHINNHGNTMNFGGCYKAGDGKLVLIINMGTTSYTSARAQLYVKGHDDQFDSSNIYIESIYSSSSSAAVY